MKGRFDGKIRLGWRGLVVAMAFAGVALLAACGSSDDGDGGSTTGSQADGGAAQTESAATAETLTVGIAPPGDAEFYELIKKGIADCDEDRIEMKYQTPTSHEAVEEQQSILEGWLNQDFDAIAVTTVGEVSALDQLFADATEDGVGMYFMNMAESQLDQMNRENYVSSVGYNNFEAAKLLGEWVSENIGPSGKVAVLLGTPGVHATDRLEGFEAGAGTGWEVVAKQQADWAQDKGQTVSETILQGNPDIDLIYGENDSMGLGAVQAVSSRGLEDQVDVVSLDGIEDAVQSIADGELTATMNVLPREQGCQLAQNILTVADGGTVPKIDDVEVHVTDAGNAEEDLQAFQ